MLEMQASYNSNTEDDMERKCFEWEQAVTEELRLLDEKQNYLENLIEGENEDLDATKSPQLKASMISIIRNKNREKYDALTESIEKTRTDTRTENAELINEINSLKNRVDLLETENDSLIDKISRLSQDKNITGDRIELDARFAELKRSFTIELDKVKSGFEKEIVELKNTIRMLQKSSVKGVNSGSEGIQRIKLDIPKYRGLEN